MPPTRRNSSMRRNSSARRRNSPKSKGSTQTNSNRKPRRSSSAGPTPRSTPRRHSSILQNGKRRGSASPPKGSPTNQSPSKTQQLKAAQARIEELEALLAENASDVLLAKKESEVEALKKALESKEERRLAEVKRLYDLRNEDLAEKELQMKRLEDYFSAEKHGYRHSIDILTDSFQKERVMREEDRVEHIKRIAGLLTEEEVVDNAYAAMQENRWLNYESEVSQNEYQRLYKLYGKYVENSKEKREEGLLGFWEVLGGTAGWRQRITPAQLQLLFSRTSIPQLTFRVQLVHHLELGGSLVPESEIVGFFSAFLSRIGGLEHLLLIDCPVSPVNWFDLSPPCTVIKPFSSLHSLGLWHTVIKASDVRGLIRCLPSLEPCGFETIVNGLSLHEAHLQLDDEPLESLVAACGNKLWIWSTLVTDVSRIKTEL